jgi:hypothetical protein
MWSFENLFMGNNVATDLRLCVASVMMATSLTLSEYRLCLFAQRARMLFLSRM